MSASQSNSGLKVSLCWLAGNALGIFVYLVAESCKLAPRPEYREPTGLDMMCFWMSRELPLLFVFFVSNLIWLFYKIKRGNLSAKWKSLSLWAVVSLLWVGIVFSHGLGPPMVQILFDIIDGR
jgi:hypothetical protein